jgi:hypothetical protein
MRKLYWILIFAAVSAIFLLGYMYSSSYNFFLDGHPASWEKIAVGQVSFDSANPKNFQINVKWIGTGPADSVIVFTDAIFKNSKGEIVATGFLDERMEPGTEMTLNFSTDIDLPSGEYIITLVTERGGSFVSPSFTKP